MVEPIIDCIDCGGRCHLLVTWAADDPRQPGDIVTYRCEDCLDVWYIEVPSVPTPTRRPTDAFGSRPAARLRIPARRRTDPDPPPD